MTKRGKFITLEGIEGAGKSTQLAVARACLEGQGIPVVTTREPGGSSVAERMRGLLLDRANRGMAPDAELLLMFAARAEHLNKTIHPALEQGIWVLCDRFTDATFAYQGAGRGVPRERVQLLETLVQGPLRPDLTLLFDLPVTVGLERAGRRSAADRFESETVHFFERVRSAYLSRAEKDPGRIRVIDAAAPPELVSDRVSALVTEFVRSLEQGSPLAR